MASRGVCTTPATLHSYGEMADFVTHSLIGAGAMAAPAKVFGARKWVKNTLAVYGFVLGGAPDTFDWLYATFFGGVRWQLYTIFHHHAPWWLYYQPPFFIHVVVVDPPFHQTPGLSWWPTLWPMEVFWILVALVLLWYAYKGDK